MKKPTWTSITDDSMTRIMAEKSRVPGEGLADEYIVAVDMAAPGSDYTVRVTYQIPGKIRKFFRRIGLDRSTWERKIIRVERDL